MQKPQTVLKSTLILAFIKIAVTFKADTYYE